MSAMAAEKSAAKKEPDLRATGLIKIYGDMFQQYARLYQSIR